MGNVRGRLGVRQMLYCHWLEITQNSLQAAKLAGLSKGQRGSLEEERRQNPGYSSYLEQIRQQRQKSLVSAVEEGYRKLAFGPVGDAVQLMYPGEENRDCRELDLFNLSEIRQVKGGVELKFFSRPEALERLLALGAGGEEKGEGFYSLLRQSAEALSRQNTPKKEAGNE